MADETQPPPVERAPAAHGSARTYAQDGSIVVEFHGELDLCSVPAVREQVDAATLPAGARVIVDLRPARFLTARPWRCSVAPGAAPCRPAVPSDWCAPTRGTCGYCERQD